MNLTPPLLFAPAWRRLWTHDKALDSLKVILAFCGVLAYCLSGEHKEWLIGMILGVIAAALAETPDRLIGRLKALAVTLACFALTAAAVRLLFPYPLIFALGLALSTFAFVMLGALGERYGTIATASLILAVYTMLSISQYGKTLPPFWQEPTLLLAGAAWYGLISIAAVMAFPNRPLRQVIAQVYFELGKYLELKARLLEPVSGRDMHALRLALATQNGRVVGLMNRARELLILWVQIGRPARGSEIYMHWYFIAQDIHERASSAHRPYEALIETFARSDVLFRCYRLLSLQAEECTRLGDAVAAAESYTYGTATERAIEDLDAALACISDPGRYDASLTDSLHDLRRNVGNINTRLAEAAAPSATHDFDDLSLRDKSARTITQMASHLRREFTPTSRRFRHGLRLAAALTVGYGLLGLLALPQGYWVMLTTLFVCQPNFSSTWTRLGQRVGGTVIGLLIAVLFIGAFPHHLAQLALIVASGVAFFFWRADRYWLATACITVLVLVCFNQFGSSYALVWPRLLDTLLGCALSVGAVALILPEWHGRRLHQVMAHALKCSVAYLTEILSQYRTGKRDDLPYRIARRDVHNADADLSSTLTGMLAEPGRYHLPPEAAYRFLCASHTLLGYISALGAHREKIDAWQTETPIREKEARIRASLEAIARALTSRSQVTETPDPMQTATPTHGGSGSEAARRVLQQLTQIESLLPELRTLANGFAEASSLDRPHPAIRA